jgi:hypothetical protein
MVNGESRKEVKMRKRKVKAENKEGNLESQNDLMHFLSFLFGNKSKKESTTDKEEINITSI